MRKAIFIILLQYFILAQGQSLINPYFDFTTPQNPVVWQTFYRNTANNLVHQSISDEYTFTSSAYNGEYMIILQPNRNQASNTGFDNPSWHAILANHGLTYQMELISFPFTPDACWYNGGCCNCNSNPNPVSIYERQLYMPDIGLTPYNLNTHKWGELTNVKSNGILNPAPVTNPPSPYYILFSDNSSYYMGGGGSPEKLVSHFFTLYDINVNYNGITVLPHSAIKHSIFVHCTDINSPVIDTISWVYDNTRGRMRYYPFKNENTSSNDLAHDITFLPEFIHRPFDINNQINHDYSELNNIDWLLPGDNTIDYWSYKNAPANCPTATASGNYFPTGPSEVFFDNISKGFERGRPAPYSLLSAYARGPQGKDLAGYNNSSGSALSYTASFTGIKHQYFIDQNIDLNIINPVEKIIYNPSEVSVTANDLVFPSGYTFKTIRGIYSSVALVMADDLAENGGPFADLRDVPVRTDLRSENSSDPNDPNDISHSVYAGRYYLRGDSKLTIENCVKLFDCAFDVNTGATLIINDYPQLLGKEHINGGLGRYKLIGKGGAVLRNYKAIQYVQNGLINQPFPLIYKAQELIFIGYDVDPDIDQADGDYTITSGGEVHFQSVYGSSLMPGFSANAGSSFSATTGAINLPQPCPQYLSGGGSQNRVMKNVNSSPLSFSFELFPNPLMKENIKLKIANHDANIIYEALIYDYKGMMLQKVHITSEETELPSKNLAAGYYIVELKKNDQTVERKKFVKI